MIKQNWNYPPEVGIPTGADAWLIDGCCPLSDVSVVNSTVVTVFDETFGVVAFTVR